MKTGSLVSSPRTVDECDDCLSPEQRRRDKRHGRGLEKAFWAEQRAEEQRYTDGPEEPKLTHRQQVRRIPRELLNAVVMAAAD